MFYFVFSSYLFLTVMVGFIIKADNGEMTEPLNRIPLQEDFRVLKTTMKFLTNINYEKRTFLANHQ